MNLAAAFVNGFVNCGFGNDKMVMESSEAANKFFYQNKDFGELKLVFEIELSLYFF